MVAGLNPSRLPRAKVRDPTGSPVVMKLSTIAVRISRSRSPIGWPDCIEFLPRGSRSAKTLKNNSLGRQQPRHGDGKADLFVFNGDDWSMSYLGMRSEEHTSELQSLTNLVCRLLLEK